METPKQEHATLRLLNFFSTSCGAKCPRARYAAEDLDGHHLLFSRHAKDCSLEDWGAAVKR